MEISGTLKFLNTLYPIKTSQKCYECGSFMFLIDKRTEIVEGQRSPITTSLYRCSDKTCSDDFDKKTVLRAKQREEQETAKINRMETMKQNRIKNMSEKAS